MGKGMSMNMVVTIMVVMMMILSKGARGSNWCVCRKDVNETALQKTLDYACGAGADCNPIHSNGVCYSPNTVLAHCNYAVNSFFQRKAQAPGTCDFLGVAIVTATDPSYTTCSFPASASSSTSTSTSTGTGTGTGTVPVTAGSTNPYTTNNQPGILGGMGPSGTSIDDSSAFPLLAAASYYYCFCFFLLLLL